MSGSLHVSDRLTLNGPTATDAGVDVQQALDRCSSDYSALEEKVSELEPLVSDGFRSLEDTDGCTDPYITSALSHSLGSVASFFGGIGCSRHTYSFVWNMLPMACHHRFPIIYSGKPAVLSGRYV